MFTTRNLTTIIGTLAVAAMMFAAPTLLEAYGNKTAAKAEEEAKSLSVGDKAPNFTLKDIDGEEHSLSDWEDKIVVIEWTNPHCPFVVRHHKAKTMANIHEKYKDNEDVVFVAVNSTNEGHDDFIKPEDYKKIYKDAGLTFPTLYDADGKVGMKYGARTTPHMFIVHKDGTIAYNGAIDDDPRGKSDEPHNYVAAALANLVDGDMPEKTSTKPYGCSVKYAKK